MVKPRRSFGVTLAGMAAIGACLLCALTSHPVIAQVTSKPDGADSGPNLVKNGSFNELDANGRPTGWGTWGPSGIEQAITMDPGPAGKRALKLTCTKFAPGPASFAMLLQNGAVGLKKGQFYKFSWWAKGGRLAGAAESLPTMAATVDIVNNSSWTKQFGETFRIFPGWRAYARVFQASDDLSAATSRLAFYMKGTAIRRSA
jgi:hypothetical protein